MVNVFMRVERTVSAVHHENGEMDVTATTQDFFTDEGESLRKEIADLLSPQMAIGTSFLATHPVLYKVEDSAKAKIREILENNPELLKAIYYVDPKVYSKIRRMVYDQ